MKFLNKSNVLSFLAGLAASAAVCAVVIGVDVASDTATQDQTEESAEATVRALHEQRPAEYKSRNSDRSFAGRLLALQAQLDDGAITEAQYSDE